MPEIHRQSKSGALIFKPTIQEQTMADTQKALDEKSKALDIKLAEVDSLIEKFKSLDKV